MSFLSLFRYVFYVLMADEICRGIAAATDLIFIIPATIKTRFVRSQTQDQVVAKLNLMGISISKSTYAKLETNRMNIKVSELVALSEIFSADFNAFFTGF